MNDHKACRCVLTCHDSEDFLQELEVVGLVELRCELAHAELLEQILCHQQET